MAVSQDHWYRLLLMAVEIDPGKTLVIDYKRFLSLNHHNFCLHFEMYCCCCRNDSPENCVAGLSDNCWLH